MVVIGLTLAFAFFIGGFFTGRSWSAVNIVPAVNQNENSHNTEINLRTPDTPVVRDENVQDSHNNQNNQSNQNSIEEPPIATTPSSQAESTPPSETIGVPSGGDGKININLASQSELTDLPGIGSVLASRIIDYRRQHGNFIRIEDLRNVTGIGEKRYEAIQDKITVG